MYHHGVVVLGPSLLYRKDHIQDQGLFLFGAHKERESVRQPQRHVKEHCAFLHSIRVKCTPQEGYSP